MLRIGICSWTDPTLVKDSDFYPKGVRTPEQRLRFYAEQFSLVEVDSTYYRLPDESASVAWEERTPGGFVFDVKAYALLTTHPAPVKSLPPDLRESLPAVAVKKRNLYWRDLTPDVQDELWRRFRQALLPLQLSGKLGAILLQFPAWFFPTHESREHIRLAKTALAGFACAIEFRHGSWLNDKNRERTLAFLRDEELTYVGVDEPQEFPSSVPPVLAVTNPALAMVRFHGHNAAAWTAKGISASERFRYLYNQTELEQWQPRIEQISAQARETHVLMNNCYRDYAVTNARQLAEAMSPSRPRILGTTT